MWARDYRGLRMMHVRAVCGVGHARAEDCFDPNLFVPLEGGHLSGSAGKAGRVGDMPDPFYSGCAGWRIMLPTPFLGAPGVWHDSQCAVPQTRASFLVVTACSHTRCDRPPGAMVDAGVAAHERMGRRHAAC